MRNEMIYRFLKSRAEIDPNADLLADLLESNRAIDAVVLNTDGIESQEKLLDFAELSYYLMEIQGKVVLIYPNEEREKYLSIQDNLRFGDHIAYNGLTYSELEAIKDYLDCANTDYKVSVGDSAKMGILVSKQDHDALEKAIQKLKEEISTDIGERYLVVSNRCWANTVSQVSKAMEAETAFIGSDGGQNGIRIDKNGALIMTTTGTKYLSRKEKGFQRQLNDVVMRELDGKHTPVKVFYGEEAKTITYGMEKGEKRAMTTKEALKIAGFSKMPDIDTLAGLAMESLPEDKEKAVYALIRMNLCRSMRIQEVKKLSKEEKMEYEALHAHYLHEFAEELRSQIDMKEPASREEGSR